MIQVLQQADSRAKMKAGTGRLSGDTQRWKAKCLEEDYVK
jgi:hypothetical protein